ncbi:hypothetical protein ABSA28_00453 [Candidatus Hepatincolaceae symbiont of Richtersius coronifer]
MPEILTSRGQQVINYTDNEISIFQPDGGSGRYIAYLRPGDNILLNFDIKTLKVDIVKGDLQILFPNGSSITLASMVALGFSSVAPTLKSVDGKVFSLEEFLNQTEVLNYNEAILILANRDSIKYSQEEEEDIIRVASEQDSTLSAGNPISGVGTIDTPTKGLESVVINQNGSVVDKNPYSGTGTYAITSTTSNMPYNSDQSQSQPGEAELALKPTLDNKVKYGSRLERGPDTLLNSINYETYYFKSGIGFTDEPTAQLVPNIVNASNTSQPIFINNKGEMKYVLELNYGRGVFPNSIDIVVPSAVAGDISINSSNPNISMTGPFVNAAGNTYYKIDSPDPLGTMQINLAFPENYRDSEFELSYDLYYFSLITGQLEISNVSQAFSIKKVINDSDVNSSGNRAVLSSVPNPINVTTGDGGDIILGGGGSNTMVSGKGNDKVFSNSGNDTSDLGEGDDSYWASSGTDIINGGSGNNNIYYNNYVDTAIVGSASSSTFAMSNFNTYTALSGLQAFLGLTKDKVVDKINSILDTPAVVRNQALAAIGDDTFFIAKASGYDIVNNIQNVYLSKLTNNVTVGSNNSKLINLFSGTVNDIIRIDDSFTNAVIDLNANNISVGTLVKYNLFNNHNSTNPTTFTNIVGSANADIFRSGNLTASYVLNGGTNAAGVGDTISYEDLVSPDVTHNYTITFFASSSIVDKVRTEIATNTVELVTGRDTIFNFSNIVGTLGDDIFYASSDAARNYNYTLTANDKLTYDLGNTGQVTWDVDANKIYKTTGAISSTTVFDRYTPISSDRITLTRGADIVLITNATVSYTGLDANIGRDILDYTSVAGVSGSPATNLTFTFIGDSDPNALGGQGEITKETGTSIVTDTFSIYTKYATGNQNFYTYKGTTTGNNNFNVNINSNITYSYSFVGNGNVALTNTLDYSSSIAGAGIRFNFGSSDGRNTALKYFNNNLVGIDDFQAITNFIGTAGDDSIIFGAGISNVNEIKNFNVDLREGTNSLDFSALSATLIGVRGSPNPATSASIIVSFAALSSGTSATVKVWVIDKFDPTASTVLSTIDAVVGSIEDVNFNSVLSAVGTARNDVFKVLDGINQTLIITGRGGDDTADYRNIITNLSFNLLNSTISRASGAVRYNDSFSSIEYFYGGTGNNSFLSSANGSYSFYGNSAAAQNILSYINLASSTVSIDFLNSTVDKGISNRDRYSGMSDFVGSRMGDRFIAYDNTAGSNALAIKIDGGGAVIGYDIIDFSGIKNFTNLNVNLNNAININYANINWDLINVNGIIATANDDNFIIIGDQGYSIDGQGGNDTLSYTSTTGISNTTAVRITLNNLIGVNRTISIAGGPAITVQDNITNIEELILSRGDDNVMVTKEVMSSGVTSIDGGAGINTMDFAAITTLDLVVNLQTFQTTFTSAGGPTPHILTHLNFLNFRASSGNTTFLISNTLNNASFIASTVIGANTVVDFSNFTTINLNLAASANGGGTFSATTLSGNFSGANLTFSQIRTYKLTNGNDTVVTSAGFNGQYEGNGGIDTADYTSFNGVITLEIGTVGVGGGATSDKVIKGSTSDVLLDFKKIIGTAGNDTVKLQNNSRLVEVDLLGGNNLIEFNLSTAVNYIYSSGVINDLASGNNINISQISSTGGTLGLVLTAANDTFIFDAVPVTASALTRIDGGGGDNTVDATSLAAGGGGAFFAFNANTSRAGVNFAGAAPAGDPMINNINWTNFTLNRFTTINGSNTLNNYFFGSHIGSYVFQGGTVASSNSILSYVTSQTSLTFDLTTNKVTKPGTSSSVDSYSNINKIIGSVFADIFKITDLSLTYAINSAPTGQNNSNIADTLQFIGSDITGFDIAGTGLTHIIQTSTGGLPGITQAFEGIRVFEFTNNNATATTINITGRLDTAFSFRDTSSVTTNSTIAYSNVGNFTYDATVRVVSRQNVGGGIIIDKLSNILNINHTSYAVGTTSLFIGSTASVNNYTGNNNNSFLDYSNISTGLEVTFDAAGTHKAIKGSGPGAPTDIFKGMNSIKGSIQNDVFIIFDNTGATTIKIDGGLGANTVSFENIGSGSVNYTAANLTGGGGIVNGFTLTNITTYRLTNNDDTYSGDRDSAVDIDGGNGNDLLDYSALPSSGAYNVEINFVTGVVTKYENTNASIVFNPIKNTDRITNFERAKTGAGDDTFILSNAQIAPGSDTDSGAGINSINFAAITSNGSYAYTASTKVLAASFSIGAAINYLNFTNIIIGQGSTSSGLDNIFNFNETAGAGIINTPTTYTIEAVNTGIHTLNLSVANTSLTSSISGISYNYTANFRGVDDTIRSGANITLNTKFFTTINFDKSAYVQSDFSRRVNINFNAAGNNVLDYSAATSSLTVTSDGSQLNKFSITSPSITTAAEISNVGKIILGDFDDIFIVPDPSSAVGAGTLPGVYAIIDGGRGTNSVSYSAYTSGITLDLAVTTTTSTTYRFDNFNKFSLSNNDDKVTIGFEKTFEIDGAVGAADKVTYVGLPFAPISAITINIGEIATTPNIIRIIKSGGVDQLSNIEEIELTAEVDTLRYLRARTSGNALTVDFKGVTSSTVGVARDLADFSQATSAGKGIFNINTTGAQQIKVQLDANTAASHNQYILKSLYNLTGTQGNDDFIFDTDILSADYIIKGSLGNNAIIMNFIPAASSLYIYDFSENLIKKGSTDIISFQGINSLDLIAPTAAGLVQTVIIGDVDSTGQNTAVTIRGKRDTTTGNIGTLTVDYSKSLLGINAIYTAADRFDVTKTSTGASDTLYNISTLLGTNYDDTFVINSYLVDPTSGSLPNILTINGNGAVSGDKVDLKNLAGVQNRLIKIIFNTTTNQYNLELNSGNIFPSIINIINISNIDLPLVTHLAGLTYTIDYRLDPSMFNQIRGSLATSNKDDRINFQLTPAGTAGAANATNLVLDLVSASSLAFSLTDTTGANQKNYNIRLIDMDIYNFTPDLTANGLKVILNQLSSYQNISVETPLPTTIGITTLDLSNYASSANETIIINPGTSTKSNVVINSKLINGVNFNNSSTTGAIIFGSNKKTVVVNDTSIFTATGTTKLHLDGVAGDNKLEWRHTPISTAIYKVDLTDRIILSNTSHYLAAINFQSLILNFAGTTASTNITNINFTANYTGQLREISFLDSTTAYKPIYHINMDTAVGSSTAVALTLYDGRNTSTLVFKTNSIALTGSISYINKYQLTSANDTVTLGDYTIALGGTNNTPTTLIDGGGGADRLVLTGNSVVKTVYIKGGTEQVVQPLGGVNSFNANFIGFRDIDSNAINNITYNLGNFDITGFNSNSYYYVINANNSNYSSSDRIVVDTNGVNSITNFEIDNNKTNFIVNASAVSSVTSINVYINSTSIEHIALGYTINITGGNNIWSPGAPAASIQPVNMVVKSLDNNTSKSYNFYAPDKTPVSVVNNPLDAMNGVDFSTARLPTGQGLLFKLMQMQAGSPGHISGGVRVTTYSVPTTSTSTTLADTSANYNFHQVQQIKGSTAGNNVFYYAQHIMSLNVPIIPSSSPYNYMSYALDGNSGIGNVVIVANAIQTNNILGVQGRVHINTVDQTITRMYRGLSLVDTYTNIQKVSLPGVGGTILTIGTINPITIIYPISRSAIYGHTFYELSQSRDVLNIFSMEANQVIDTGSGLDDIFFGGDALVYKVGLVHLDNLLLNGTTYNTGGSYLFITDGLNNFMYLLNSTYGSIVANGLYDINKIYYDTSYLTDLSGIKDVVGEQIFANQLDEYKVLLANNITNAEEVVPEINVVAENDINPEDLIIAYQKEVNNALEEPALIEQVSQEQLLEGQISEVVIEETAQILALNEPTSGDNNYTEILSEDIDLFAAANFMTSNQNNISGNNLALDDDFIMRSLTTSLNDDPDSLEEIVKIVFDSKEDNLTSKELIQEINSESDFYANVHESFIAQEELENSFKEDERSQDPTQEFLANIAKHHTNNGGNL